MSEILFRLGILYTTIAVIHPNENLNDWNDVHVNQGFSWRATSVSFGTLSDEPECEVSVSVSDKININKNAIRVITVPFFVGLDGIEVISIADSQPIDIEEGVYELVFSAIPASENNGIDKYEFVFVKNNKPTPKIIKADEGLNPPEELLMKANPAI